MDTIYRIIVAGTRDFDNYELMKEKLLKLFSCLDFKDITIVSGMARGADSLGEKFAKDNHIQIKEFPANWNKYGKPAGYIRNKEMAKYSTHCVVFWDGISKGTKHMIDLAKEFNLNLRVIKY